MRDLQYKIKSVILGHAVADALGVPVEFSSREELKKNPVTGMMGYGTYPVPAGSWSDDTSMSLCALESLTKGEVDFDDVMNNFRLWLYEDKFTPTGKTFDVGKTCGHAVDNYDRGEPYDKCGLSGEWDNGNGSLMRINPYDLYAYAKLMRLGPSLRLVYKASALTHSHPRAKIGCGLYSIVLWEILKKPTKEAMIKEIENAFVLYDGYAAVSEEYDHYKELECYDFAHKAQIKNKTEEEIKSSGYIVDTLEAALWCVITTDSYKECVLKAVNLGSDTDTVAAVAGGLAGALYGYDAIPKEWLDTLIKREYIEDMCERACQAWIK